MPSHLPSRLQILVVILAFTAAATLAIAEVTVLGVQYKADQAFPEHDCFWDAANYPSSCPPTDPLGGSIHVFLRNNGSTSVTVQDVVFSGMSLAEVLSLHFQVVKRQPASVWLAALTSQELQMLLDAGEPVWYKIDPATIAPGGTGQVVVRLRQTPAVPSIGIDVVHSAGTTSTAVPVQLDQPTIAGASFSSDLTKAYLYWRRVAGTAAPTTILFNGNNVTANTTTVSDSTLPYAASVVQLGSPVVSGSFHVFQGVYADGKTASAGVRPWVNNFIYGTWSAMPCPEGDAAAARAVIDDATNRFINAQVVQGEPGLNDYFKTASGRQYAADRGYGFVIDEVGKWSCTNPLMWFIRDEPDAADSRVTGIPENKKVGSLAQMAVQTGEELRANYPTAPTTINLDMTYKPFNWYNYGQVPDVMMSDPYYQVRLREAYWSNPGRIPLYQKATFVYAVSQLAQSAAEPNPMHIILYSCEYRDATTGQIWPFPTTQSKRIEVYYALAAGAKGISYWWYKPGYPSNGLGARTSAALALWKETGLLGAEIRTAAPLLVTSCPAALTMQAGSGVWARSLLVGADTFVLLVVNDNYYNNQQGCQYAPVANASLSVTLPGWLQSPTAFEIAAGGIRNVATQIAGGQLQINLGTLNLTRMIVVTSNTLLRSSIEERYEQQVRAKVCGFAPEVCVAVGPTITQHPVARNICPGATTTFTAAASGSGTLSYQWQKNSSNITDGGHYSGCTTATLTVSNADGNAAANYRCAVSDINGTNTSNQAALTLKATTTISQHPSSTSVAQGKTATFTVAATGDGTLGYQWQKNGSNLTNGGHYSGCTTATLTISNADSNDAASYRCVVAGGCGSATSNAASLMIAPPGDFDGDNDVDMNDFAHFQACLTTPQNPQATLPCLDARMDPDDDVDAADMNIFLRCLRGAHIPADPNCAN
ncbi:MAG TPA: immunoglobulin domain-containing protein [Phycisphaerae bacterium]|nr:immunoglobulin domain-containing protein [Phycisphaerae bacterium]